MYTAMERAGKEVEKIAEQQEGMQQKVQFVSSLKFGTDRLS